MSQTMRFRTRRSYDLPPRDNKYGYLNITGLYELIGDDLERDYSKVISKLDVYPSTGMHPIKFSKVVSAYLKHVFNDALDTLMGVDWYPGFGRIVVSKILCVLYNPLASFRAGGEQKQIKIDIKKTGGYHTYFAWQRKGFFYAYKIIVSSKWKWKLKSRINEGNEYLHHELKKAV